MPIDHRAIVSEIDDIITQYRALRDKAPQHGHSEEQVRIITTMADAVKRFAPPGSHYIDDLNGLKKSVPSLAGGALLKGLQPSSFLAPLYGILSSLRDGYDAGRLTTVHELIHADVFADMLEQAEYLLSEHFITAAAVTAGAVHEEHIHNLCIKHGVPVNDANNKARKTQVLNQDLRTAGAYDLNEEKSVTARCGFRNTAAHVGGLGEYTDVKGEQVRLFIEGVRLFVKSYLA